MKVHLCAPLIVLFLTAVTSMPCSFAQPAPSYKNAGLPVEERVKDLLSRMTPEEKFWQLFMIPADAGTMIDSQYSHGIFGFQLSSQASGDEADAQLLHYDHSASALAQARQINALQKYFLEKTRLGIPIIPFDEALHGLVRDGATAFPQAIGLAATWDTSLVSRVAAAIAQETKMRGIRQILGPVINIGGDPRWGRTEETYGEDPFLCSSIAVSFIRAFERAGVITTPKHLIANYGDGGRDSYPVDLDERILDEVYLYPFKKAFEKAGARSVMTAYNSFDGSPCTANGWLLNKKLKGDWRFTGFVISDASATGGAQVLHFTARDYPSAGAKSIRNGLDVIFQTAYEHYKLFIPPFLDGRIPAQRIDDAVSRVLRAKFELGLFEDPYADTVEIIRSSKDRRHKALAGQAARESVVLLKNKNILPLARSIRSLAVIGTDAVEARLGGYSGPGNSKISILEGIREKTGPGIQIHYAPGCGREKEEWTPVPADFLQTEREGKTLKGLFGEYFNNIDLQGTPDFSRQDGSLDFSWTFARPAPGIKNDFFSARWTGSLLAPTTGRYKIGLSGDDGFRLYIDHRLVIDNWTKRTYSSMLTDFDFEKGKRYNIRIEFFEPSGNARIRLVWNIGVDTAWKERIREAVAAASQSSVAIIVAGIKEGEFQDRAFLSLPGYQEEMIRQVAATGKPVVVLLIGGSAITMSNWLDQTAAVLDAWYPGEEGGHALADILFGDYNPAGRLPVTFPVFEGQLPMPYDHKPTGRGDDYNDLSGLPLFPFGFGLSYTSFGYGELQFERQQMGVGDSTRIHFSLKNLGNREGDEVVQLYIRDLEASVAQPVIALKGFQRVHLAPGESKEVSFEINPAMLSILNKDLQTVVEPGEFRIMIGSSSRDIRLKGNLEIK